ncbi:MAG: hypothetical protein GX944_02080 [Alphaproteobacteria bacterium]|nr:hypothetical protein [Alphaproteobacteria bacterium]
MKQQIKCFIIIVCIAILSPLFVYANDTQTTSENQNIISSTCAQRVFANALMADAASVDEESSEADIQVWIYNNFQDSEVVKKILECPEVKELDEEDTITVPPVEYQFSGGRKIVVNYETQPKILKQRLLLANKRALPCTTDDCVSPAIGVPGDTNIWTNTEPAWYGILVVQAGALDNFIGEEKNNTISLRYFEDNFNAIYPKNHNTTKVRQAGGLITLPLCTSVSAFADNGDIVNQAVRKTVGLKDTGEKDTNDYYVAGLANLRWISWAQVAVDVVITVATVGGGTLILGLAKGARATRAAKLLANDIKILRNMDKVKDYISSVKNLSKNKNLVKELDAISDINKLKLDKSDDLAKILKNSNATDRMAQIQKNMHVAEQNLSRTNLSHAQKVKYQQEINRQRNLFKKELETLSKTKDAKLDEIKKLEKAVQESEKLDDVKKYKEAVSSFEKLQELRRGMKAWKIPQRGNVIARSWRAAKGFRKMLKGEKTIRKAEKVARVGIKSGKIRNWLFVNTAKNIGRLAKMERQFGIAYGAIKFIGDMYDWTETSTGEFTSNIEFKPLGLLSADDLSGQENVVNHGMWLMWAGDSISPADDDAAFLQAMDFANKFHQDMQEIQEEKAEQGRLAITMCNVDIFVVRPIIRNPDSDYPELYYLIMNDIPWKVRTE